MVFGLFCLVVPKEEMSLLASLMNIAPKEDIVAFEEPDTIELPPPPAKASKGKGRAKKTAPQDSSQIVTWSSLKTPVKPPTFPRYPSVAPSIAPSIVPSGNPLAFGPHSIATPSHSSTSLLSLPQKRKVALLDTSVTSWEAPNTLLLIKNVDMVQLMVESKLAGGTLPAYTRIQEFIAKVCMFHFVIFQASFVLVCLFFFLALVFSLSFNCRMGQVVPV